MSDILKPCPFCGGEADYLTIEDKRFGLIHKTECVNCDYTIGSWQAGDNGRENAAKEWNTRPAVEPVVPLSEVLELLDGISNNNSALDIVALEYKVISRINDFKQKYGASE